MGELKYTEADLIFAMEFQKATDYQRVGGFLINNNPQIREALDYLADNEIASIEDIKEDLKHE